MFYNNTASLSYSDSERRTNNGDIIGYDRFPGFRFTNRMHFTLKSVSLMNPNAHSASRIPPSPPRTVNEQVDVKMARFLSLTSPPFDQIKRRLFRVLRRRTISKARANCQDMTAIGAPAYEDTKEDVSLSDLVFRRSTWQENSAVRTTTRESTP